MGESSTRKEFVFVSLLFTALGRLPHGFYVHLYGDSVLIVLVGTLSYYATFYHYSDR